jgi:diacylglycerol kinase family enzyme
VVLGRTAHYGGPFKITTGASLFEDSFEILTNSKRSRFGYLICLPALWLGKLRQMKGIDAWKTTAAICEAAGNEPVYAQVDGEPIGPAPISFRIVPDALSLVTPGPTRAQSSHSVAPIWNPLLTR